MLLEWYLLDSSPLLPLNARPSSCSHDDTHPTPLHNQMIDNSEFKFGRYFNTPFSLDMSIVPLKNLRQFFNLKRWHYMSIDTELYFISFAIVHVSFCSALFLFLR
jgi:hypothetical protein